MDCLSTKRYGSKVADVMQRRWLSFYLDSENPVTFMNGARSAEAAGYSPGPDPKWHPHNLSKAGSRLRKRFAKEIAAWLHNEGLSEVALKAKLMVLLDAKETKFFSHQGEVREERDVEALEIRRKALDMAFKVKGMYAAEKHEFKGGAPVHLIVETGVPSPPGANTDADDDPLAL